MPRALDARKATDRPSSPRRRRLALALAPLPVAGVAVAIVLGTRSSSPPASVP
jgi:hypothetical protein